MIEVNSLPDDFAEAETFVEAADHPIAGGRWHVLTDGSVLYERRRGEYERAVVAAETLRSNPTWRRTEP